jgi:hypothetical protein
MRRFAPRLEGMERRDLRTVMGLRGLSADVLGHAQSFAAQVLNNTPAPIPPVPPLIAGPGQPLPNEIARTRFSASFSGPFLKGPPRYTGESAVLDYRGLGTSTQFLHGDYQMAIVMPNPAGGPITGAAFLQDKNITGGNEIGLDINFDATTLDRRGRPTQGIWVTDPNIYSGANYFNSGTGTVTIRYLRNGTAAAFFRGSIYTNGITNLLRNDDLYSK